MIGRVHVDVVNGFRTDIVDDISEFVRACLLFTPTLFVTDHEWQESIVCIVEEYLQEEYRDTNAIRTFKVIGDSRNNTKSQLSVGTFVLEVSFRHIQSLIDTKLTFTTENR